MRKHNNNNTYNFQKTLKLRHTNNNKKWAHVTSLTITPSHTPLTTHTHTYTHETYISTYTQHTHLKHIQSTTQIHILTQTLRHKHDTHHQHKSPKNIYLTQYTYPYITTATHISHKYMTYYIKTLHKRQKYNTHPTNAHNTCKHKYNTYNFQTKIEAIPQKK